jgi:hypothetical protein
MAEKMLDSFKCYIEVLETFAFIFMLICLSLFHAALGFLAQAHCDLKLHKEGQF